MICVEKIVVNGETVRYGAVLHIEGKTGDEVRASLLKDMIEWDNIRSELCLFVPRKDIKRLLGVGEVGQSMLSRVSGLC